MKAKIARSRFPVSPLDVPTGNGFKQSPLNFSIAHKMKTPICSFDARTGVLCPKCNARLKTGQLSSTDVEVAIKLTKAAAKNPEIDKMSLVKGN